MVESLTGQPLFSITPDRGKEFSLHKEVTKELGVEFHHPWNTNGLLLEYFPKGQDLTDLSNNYIQSKVTDLNNRSRKCLDYKTSAEIYYSISLHLT